MNTPEERKLNCSEADGCDLDICCHYADTKDSTKDCPIKELIRLSHLDLRAVATSILKDALKNF